MPLRSPVSLSSCVPWKWLEMYQVWFVSVSGHFNPNLDEVRRCFYSFSLSPLPPSLSGVKLRLRTPQKPNITETRIDSTSISPPPIPPWMKESTRKSLKKKLDWSWTRSACSAVTTTTLLRPPEEDTETEDLDKEADSTIFSSPCFLSPV
jgi:hypothetical protein